MIVSILNGRYIRIALLSILCLMWHEIHNTFVAKEMYFIFIRLSEHIAKDVALILLHMYAFRQLNTVPLAHIRIHTESIT